MAETALYRKYRPQRFKDVIGQDHITLVLEGAIERGAISHAYLFSGSRGTGKTSVARIFAREIGTSPNDLYEIDAASNRGIDDVRAIRDGVSVLPFESKYKVYIVDEVHMLTKEAFNALLKTLEEPPSHAVFILATTEIEKLPDTIVSRCETHQFKKPNQQILKEMVVAVAKKEGISIDTPSAELIALLGDGSFRDAQGILQKIIGSGSSSDSGKKISLADIEKITGAPKAGLVNDVIAALAEKNIDKGVGAARRAGEGNIDMKLFLKLILQKLRFVLLLRVAPTMKKVIEEEVSEEDFAFLEKLAGEKNAGINSRTLVAFIDAYEQTGRTYIPELPLELALISSIGNNSEE